jgi:hypothetical protein
MFNISKSFIYSWLKCEKIGTIKNIISIDEVSFDTNIMHNYVWCISIY